MVGGMCGPNIDHDSVRAENANVVISVNLFIGCCVTADSESLAVNTFTSLAANPDYIQKQASIHTQSYAQTCSYDCHVDS